MARDKEDNRSLCWDCENGRADRCRWVGFFEKIEGWSAKKVMYPSEKKAYTYVVKTCPNFIEDKPRAKTRYYAQLRDEQYEKRRNKILERQKIYREEHREEIKIKNREYYLKKKAEGDKNENIL